MLTLDERSYHAWSHRRFVVELLGIPTDQELEEIEIVLSHTPNNNSAWSYRYFLVKNQDPAREQSYALRVLSLHPDCESAWTYLDAFVDDYSEIEFEAHITLNNAFYLERLACSGKLPQKSVDEMFGKLDDLDPQHKELWRWRRAA